MSADTMLCFLENCTPEARLGLHVASQCAPVLKDLKVSNLISVRPGEWRQLRQHLHPCRILCAPLYQGENRDVLLLYRDTRMKNLLSDPKICRFLQKYGYTSFNIAAVLRRLRHRYSQYAGGNGEFPHELGVLLDYPVEDVESYILNRGENSLMTRYWKVYHNLPKAEQIFRAYDAAKEQAMAEIIGGWRLSQVVV
ncbi:MAG: DUF3793 family protein [Clostridiales bacterium]|nr:DUF3793 family protein [Clostridiales bacterium]